MDKFKPVKQIRAQQQQVLMLFSTACSATANVMRGIASGGDNNYLKKSVQPERVILRVKIAANEQYHYTAESTALHWPLLFTPYKRLLLLSSYADTSLSHLDT